MILKNGTIRILETFLLRIVIGTVIFIAYDWLVGFSGPDYRIFVYVLNIVVNAYYCLGIYAVVSAAKDKRLSLRFLYPRYPFASSILICPTDSMRLNRKSKRLLTSSSQVSTFSSQNKNKQRKKPRMMKDNYSQ